MKEERDDNVVSLFPKFPPFGSKNFEISYVKPLKNLYASQESAGNSEEKRDLKEFAKFPDGRVPQWVFSENLPESC
jgi:hypothetical protein